jgi:hypothetical protein
MPTFIPARGRTLHLAGVCVNRIGTHYSNMKWDRDKDSPLKNFAAQGLPVLMRQLEIAQNINARLTGAAER